MAKKVFDVSNIFFAGKNFSEQDKQRVVLSPVWPAAVAVYSATGQKARVFSHMVDGQEETIFMSDENGFNLCAVQKCNSDYLFLSADSYVTHVDYARSESVGILRDYTTRLKTVDLSYMSSALRSKSKGHEAQDRLKNATQKVTLESDDIVFVAVDSMLDQRAGGTLQHPEPDRSGLHNSVFADAILGNNLSVSDKLALDTMLDKYKIEKDKYNQIGRDTVSFFDNDKWMVVRSLDSPDGFMIGVVDKTKVVEKLLQMPLHRSSVFSRSEYMVEQKPLRWYASLDVMPDDMRQSFELSCLMVKSHLPNTDYDIHNDIVPVSLTRDFSIYGRTFKYWDAIGFSIGRTGNNAVCLISKV